MKNAAELFLLIAALTAGQPVAAQKLRSHNFILNTPITVDGAQLESGSYQLNLISSGARMRLEFWQGNAFIATATGTLITGGEKYTEDSLLLRLNPDGSRSLIEVRIAGTKKSIRVARKAEVRISAKHSPL